MRVFIGIIGTLIGLVVIGSILSVLFPVVGEGNVTGSILINRTYDDVFKIIVNDPKSLEKILIPPNVEVLESSFQGFDIERFDETRCIRTSSLIRTKIYEPSLGNPIVRLKQDVLIDSNQISIHIESLDKTGSIQDICNSIRIFRYGNATVGEMSSHVCVQKKFIGNQYLKDYIDNEISSNLNARINTTLSQMKHYLELQPPVDNLKYRILENFLYPGPRKIKWMPSKVRFGVKRWE